MAKQTQEERAVIAEEKKLKAIDNAAKKRHAGSEELSAEVQARINEVREQANQKTKNLSRKDLKTLRG